MRQRLKELASERRRFGYRRLHLLLRREGVVLNWKKLYRLYRDARLLILPADQTREWPNAGSWEHAHPYDDPAGHAISEFGRLDYALRHLSSEPQVPDASSCYDFCRECVAVVVDNSLSGIRVARELDQVLEMRGTPCMVVSDNGTEFTSRAILAWQEERGVEWHYIAPGKPTQNSSPE